jgi:restriction endonuclease S subunit
MQVWTLDELILSNKVKLGRGDIISKRDIANFPGDYPIYSSAREKNGTFGFYGKYMFDEELITWSIDGGGRLFYRPQHKFSVTNVGGTLRILDKDFLDCRYLHLVLTHLHSKIQFDWVYKAHPSVIRNVYREIPIPSLAIQRNIVAKLDSAFTELHSFGQKLDEAEILVSELLNSHLNASFDSSAVNSEVKNNSSINTQPLEKVELRKLRDYISIQNGYAFSSKKFTATGGVPLIRIRDLKNGFETQINYAGVFDDTYLVNSGDLLIGMDGEFKCYEWHGGPALLNQRVCRIQNKSDVFDLKYLFYGINSHLKAIEDVTGYTTVKHLSSSTILNIEFPIPSLDEQRRIVDNLDKVVRDIESIRSQLTVKRELAGMLKQSLLSKEFSSQKKTVTV